MIVCIAAMQQECDAFLERCEKVQIISETPFKLYQASHLNQDVIVGLSGIGKVSAAAMASYVILKFQPSLIINIGSAGGLDNSLKIGDIVVASMCAYHDFDITSFGHEMSYEKGWYVFKANSTYLDKIKNLGLPQLHVGPMVCGDQFIHEEVLFRKMQDRFIGVLATDMESTAIAHVASTYNIPWVIARSISDLVFDQDNHVAFDEFLILASKQSANFVSQLITSLSN
jgi:adenosylhomocysteine nucleosidase